MNSALESGVAGGAPLLPGYGPPLNATEPGSGIAEGFKFKQSFKSDFAAISEVFPKLPAKLGDKGLQLFPTDPKDLFVPPRKAKPKQIRSV